VSECAHAATDPHVWDATLLYPPARWSQPLNVAHFLIVRSLHTAVREMSSSGWECRCERHLCVRVNSVLIQSLHLSLAHVSIYGDAWSICAAT
jgi:hypothetical protein